VGKLIYFISIEIPKILIVIFGAAQAEFYCKLAISTDLRALILM
jgi:hypothetical protein